jgi:hypothetical protein
MPFGVRKKRKQALAIDERKGYVEKTEKDIKGLQDNAD